MRNYIQRGDSLAMAVPYAGGVTAGQGMLVGALFGVAAVDAAQNAVIECQTQGVFDLAKEPALAITAGARVFWDNASRRLTTTATSNFQVGIVTAAALAADTIVEDTTQRGSDAAREWGLADCRSLAKDRGTPGGTRCRGIRRRSAIPARRTSRCL